MQKKVFNRYLVMIQVFLGFATSINVLKYHFKEHHIRNTLRRHKYKKIVEFYRGFGSIRPRFHKFSFEILIKPILHFF